MSKRITEAELCELEQPKPTKPLSGSGPWWKERKWYQRSSGGYYRVETVLRLVAEVRRLRGLIAEERALGKGKG